MEKLHIYKAHPWHGIDPGQDAPRQVRAFIEIVQTDTVKYEVDKESGYLSIDRPQKYSNIVPALYGFIPRTYCPGRVAELTNLALGRPDIEGDGDPLDICGLTEKDVTHGDIIVNARPIGGLRLLDHNQADDKIIAVMKNDAIYGNYNDIGELPEKVVKRLVHYFATYKNMPMPFDQNQNIMMDGVYGAEVARDVIARSLEDYDREISGKTR